jgi:hypothetical protein
MDLIQQKSMTPVVFENVYKGLESVPKALADLGNRNT